MLPIAINRHVTMVSAPVDQPEIRIFSPIAGLEPASILLNELNRRSDPDETWLNYIIGVLAGYREAGIKVPGFNAVITSDLPVGAGLSSSAALEFVTALTIEALTGHTLPPKEQAMICQNAEHKFADVPCGIMDQLAVRCGEEGKALLIDCDDISWKQIAIPEDIVVVVADTGVKHALGDGEYKKRRQDCEQALEILGRKSFRNVTIQEIEEKRDDLSDQLFRRARHAATEMARVTRFVHALENSDLEQVGVLMKASHDSLRDDFEVSCAELDLLVEAAYDFGPERGMFGSRMTGGGFGGSTISLVRRDAASDLEKHLQSCFEQSFQRVIEPFTTSAAHGAGIIS